MEKTIDNNYEFKDEIGTLITQLFGERPAFGGGAVLRWQLSIKLVKDLYRLKDGDYPPLVRRLSRHSGLTVKTLQEKYLNPLIDEGIIEIFHDDSSEKWRWIAKVKLKVKK